MPLSKEELEKYKETIGIRIEPLTDDQDKILEDIGLVWNPRKSNYRG